MRVNNLIAKIDELRELVTGWRGGKERSALEMDMALERVKKIYEMLRFDDGEDDDEEVVEVAPTPPVIEEAEPEIEEIIEETEPEIEEEEVVEEAEPEIEEITEEAEAEPEIEIEEEEVIIEIVEEEVEESPIFETQLFDQLGFNDRLVLSNDLFDGDFEKMKQTLAELDSQPTLDDALIYIAENYMWSGDEDGAKLLLTMLQSRY